MEEPATNPSRTSSAATAPHTSLDVTVRTNYPHLALQAVRIFSVGSIRRIECVTISVTTMNVSGMEETARSTGRSHGKTAPPVSPAGIALRTDNVIRNATTLGASLMALNVKT